jgi:hypothetical protein
MFASDYAPAMSSAHRRLPQSGMNTGVTARVAHALRIAYATPFRLPGRFFA